MKARLLLIMTAALVLSADPAPEEVKKEIQRFQGTWKFVSIETEGKKLDEKAYGPLIIMGNKITYKGDSGSCHFTFKVDATKKPKTIDITFMDDGLLKGVTIFGIYELDEDTFKACYNVGSQDSKGRPTEFASKKGTDPVVSTLKREKP